MEINSDFWVKEMFINQPFHITNVISNSEQWDSIRKKLDITASELPTLVGYNQYKTVSSLFKEKIVNKGIFKDLVADSPSTWADGRPLKLKETNEYRLNILQHGHDNEPLALDLLSNLLGVEIHPPGIFIFPEPHNYYWGATPDGLLKDDKGGFYALVEVKCPFKRTWRDMTQDDAIPYEHYLQIQFQMFVTKIPLCYYAIWEYKSMAVFKIQFDMKIEQQIRDYLQVYKNYFNHIDPHQKESIRVPSRVNQKNFKTKIVKLATVELVDSMRGHVEKINVWEREN